MFLVDGWTAVEKVGRLVSEGCQRDGWTVKGGPAGAGCDSWVERSHGRVQGLFGIIVLEITESRIREIWEYLVCLVGL